MNDIDNYPRSLGDKEIPYFYQNCQVTRVYDGDTITVILDHGFGLKMEEAELRLYGLNAPEVRGSSKEAGKVTRDWLRNKLCAPDTEFDRWGHVVSGTPSFINLQTIKVGRKEQGKGKYGRYLAILWDSEGQNINWKLIDGGLAKPANY